MESLETLPVDDSIPLTLKEQQVLDEYFQPLPEKGSVSLIFYVKLLLIVGGLALLTNNAYLRHTIRRVMGKDTPTPTLHYISVGIMMGLLILALYLLDKNNLM